MCDGCEKHRNIPMNPIIKVMTSVGFILTLGFGFGYVIAEILEAIKNI